MYLSMVKTASRKVTCPESAENVEKFLQKCQDIRKLVGIMKIDVERVKILQGEISISDGKSKELQSLHAKVKKLSLTIRKNLNAMQKRISEDAGKTFQKKGTLVANNMKLNCNREFLPLVTAQSYSAGSRIRKLQYTTNVKLYSEVIEDYNKAQVEYREKRYFFLKNSLQIVNTSYSEEQIEAMIEQGKFQMFTEGIVRETRHVQRQYISDLEVRNNEILKLKKSINLLLNIFADMSIRVAEQGETVNSIESHVLSAREYISIAVPMLDSAHEHKKSVKKKFIGFKL